MQQAIKIIQTYCSDKSVVVSVSGGVDSMVLASLFAKQRHIFKRLAIMTVEHGIRGEISKRDADFVVEWSKANGLECFLYQANILDNLNGRSVELAAREYRRTQYKKMIANGFDIVALAHHADDQAETILYRILRGTGVKGLGGMSVYADHLIRPMLSVTKREIQQFADDNTIKYVVDTTNFDTDYDRNYLRQTIIPLLNERWNVTAAMQRLGQNAQAAQEYILNTIDFANVRVDGQRVFVKKSQLVDETVCLNLLYYIFESLGCDTDIDSQMVKNFLTLRDLSSGKFIILRGDILAKVIYDEIAIFRQSTDKDGSDSKFQMYFEQLVADGKCVFGDYQIVIEMANTKCLYDKIPRIRRDKCDGYRQIYSAKSLDEQKSVQSKQNSFCNQLVFDLDKVPSETVLRTRSEGDLFRSFGGKTQTLKKFLINKKIPTIYRDLPLLANGNSVIMVCGVEIGDSIKVDATTKNQAVLTVFKIN